jgi:hypothetical protein
MAATMQQTAAIIATMSSIRIMIIPPLEANRADYQRRRGAGFAMLRPAVSVRVSSNPPIGFTRFKSFVFKMDNPTL